MSYVVTNSVVAGRGGDIPVRDYLPDNLAATPLLWVHGGGFTSGGLDQKESDSVARDLAAAGRWVRTVDYRLAQRLGLFSAVSLGEHPGRFPAAHNDVLDVAADLQEASGGPIAMGGASAGANIVAGAALRMRGEGSVRPSALVLAYGTFHAELPPRPDVERDLRGPLARWAFNPKMTRKMNLNYVGDEKLLEPGYAFPGGVDLRGLPPTLVLNSRNDRLRQSGDTFADELIGAGVEVERDVIDSTHAFFNAPTTPGYRRGIAIVGDWLARHG